MKNGMLIVDRDEYWSEWTPKPHGIIDFEELDLRKTALRDRKELYERSQREIWAHPERRVEIERSFEFMWDAIGNELTIALCEHRLEKYKKNRARRTAG